METHLPLLQSGATSRFWHWLRLLFSPRQGLAWTLEREPAGWAFPLLLISLSGVLQAGVTLGVAQPRPETVGWILGAALRLALIWLGWVLLSGLLRSYFVLTGQRCPENQPRSLLAWVAVPFFVRDLLRSAYILLTAQPILCPGLSGLFCQAEAGTGIFLGQALAQFDLYLCWYAFLAWLGLRQMLGLPKTQALVGLGFSLSMVVLLRAGLGTLVNLIDLPLLRLLL